MLSLFMMLVIISISIAPSLAVIAPEDSAVADVLWSDKIDETVWDKIYEASADEKISVWVWITDIDFINASCNDGTSVYPKVFL